jgi:hypothetical protein
MARTKKSWREKLQDSKDLPKIIKPKGKGAAQYGDRMLVPSPLQVDAAQESQDEGKKRFTPWWRTVKAKGKRWYVESTYKSHLTRDQ